MICVAGRSAAGVRHATRAGYEQSEIEARCLWRTRNYPVEQRSVGPASDSFDLLVASWVASNYHERLGRASRNAYV